MDETRVGTQPLESWLFPSRNKLAQAHFLLLTGFPGGGSCS